MRTLIGVVVTLSYSVALHAAPTPAKLPDRDRR